MAAYIRKQLRSLGISPTEKGSLSGFCPGIVTPENGFPLLAERQSEVGRFIEAVASHSRRMQDCQKKKLTGFILDNEGYDRSYYSGFIGWLRPEGRTDLYVNLRCMNVKEDSLTLYAGGGLLASSELDDEFQETGKEDAEPCRT